MWTIIGGLVCVIAGMFLCAVLTNRTVAYRNMKMAEVCLLAMIDHDTRSERRKLCEAYFKSKVNE